MKTLIKKQAFKPTWTSYMACLKFMSDYLELGHSLPWIFGASGHAFIMNIHPTLCPSGPTCFSFKPINQLVSNLGMDLYGTDFDKNDKDFIKKREEAWKSTKMSLDNDMPTLGWEMNIPEFYIVHGYDKDNYLFYNFDGKTLKRKWSTLGDTEIGWVYLFSANQGKKKASVSKTLKDTFTFATEFAKKKREWSQPDYYNGQRAYDIWIEALQNDNYNLMGLTYNSQVWAECRANALEFLKEAKKKLRNKLLDTLIEHYDVINWSLQKVAGLFPMGLEKVEPEDIDTAADSLFLAKEAEKSALSEMKLVLSQL